MRYLQNLFSNNKCFGHTDNRCHFNDKRQSCWMRLAFSCWNRGYQNSRHWRYGMRCVQGPCD